MTDRDHPHYYSEGIPVDYRQHVHRPRDPGPCPECGGHRYRVNWIDVGSSEQFDYRIPGSLTCLDCEERDR